MPGPTETGSNRPPQPEEGAARLDQVRGQLRRMGYLDHSVERFLLQDALRPQRAVRTVVLLSVKVGLLGGALAALVAALFLAAVNGLTRTAPLDVVPLFLHLVPPLAVLVGLSFLVLAGVMVLILFLSHTRRIEAVSFAIAVVTALAALGMLLVRGRDLIEKLERWQQVALGGLVLLIVVGVVRIVQSGLLSLSIRLMDHAPERRASRWLWRGLLVAAAATAGMTLPAFFGVAREVPSIPASLPTRPGARAVLIGVDGVLPEELAFVRASGGLPGLDQRLANGGILLRYPRPAVPPASFWTTVATGIGDPDHGMVSLDSFQPVGLSGTLSRSGWFRWYWSTIGRATGLARYQPVLAHERRAPAFWELAARGAVPGLAINWWGTFPAAADAGLVLAHGGYQLLAEEVEGAVAPGERIAELRNQQARLVGTAVEPALASVLGAENFAAVREQALRPDAFYRDVFREHLGPTVSAAALYLPALDVLPGLVDLGAVAFGALVRWQLHEVDALIASLDPTIDIVVVVFDPGRRGPSTGAKGRALLWRRDGCRDDGELVGDTEIAPAAIASALLRTLGLPQSRELAEPPAMCQWPSPSLRLDSFGVRDSGAVGAAGDTYLENLKSLGYL